MLETGAKMKEKRNHYRRLLHMSVKKIVDVLAPKVERISVFGSYPRGRSDLFTDLDILVIMNTEKPFLERTREIYSLLCLPVDADILCYTPEEFEKLKARGFFKKILAEEVVLYEKGSC